MYFVVKRNVYLGLTILSKMFYSVKYSKLCRDCDSTADKIYRFSPKFSPWLPTLHTSQTYKRTRSPDIIDFWWYNVYFGLLALPGNHAVTPTHSRGGGSQCGTSWVAHSRMVPWVFLVAWCSQKRRGKPMGQKWVYTLYNIPTWCEHKVLVRKTPLTSQVCDN